MNWDAIGAVGEILGAMAVIASLIFVGVQIRSNTRATQTAATHNISNTFLTLFKSFSDDPEMGRLWIQQTRDISDLTASDVQRLMFISAMALKALEDAFHQYQMGQMTDDMWAGWQVQIITICSYPGVRHYWEHRKNFYSPSFQAFVDNPPPIDTILSASDFIDSVTEQRAI